MCWEGNWEGGGGVTYIKRRIMRGKYCIIENGVLLCWCGEGVWVGITYLK